MYGTVLHRIEMCSLGPHIRIQQPTSAGPPTVILSMLQVYTLKFSDPNWVVVPLKTNPHSLPFRTKTSLTLTTVDRGVLSPSCPPLEELASKSSIRNQFVCVAIVHDVIFNSAAGNQRLVLQPWNANPTESGRIDTGIRIYKHNTGYMCGESVPLVALVHGRAQMCSRSRKGKLPTLSSSSIELFSNCGSPCFEFVVIFFLFHNPFSSPAVFRLLVTVLLTGVAALLLLGEAEQQQALFVSDANLQRPPNLLPPRSESGGQHDREHRAARRGAKRHKGDSGTNGDHSPSVQLYINRFRNITAKSMQDLLVTYRKEAQKCKLPKGFSCRLTTAEESAHNADAVIHVPSPVATWLDDPLEYKKGQLHVRFQPHPVKKLDSRTSHLSRTFFDLQMTYEPSSQTPLFSICNHHTLEVMYERARNRSLDKDLVTREVQEKKKGIAAFLNGCKLGGNSHFTDAMVYLSQLMEHVKIDSYGTCAHNTDMPFPVCGPACFQEIAKQYKVVLAFGDLSSPEYISEDIYIAYRSGAVPVYYGGEEVFEFVPGAHTFIHTEQFHSAQELASFLLQVVESDELLVSYLENWNMRRIQTFKQQHCYNGTSPICQLCRTVYDMKH